MPAFTKIIQVVADRAFSPQIGTAWKDVPFQLEVTLDSAVDLSGASALAFEIHSRREWAENSLLCRSVYDTELDFEQPISLKLTGRQMNIAIPEGVSERDVYGVVYALFSNDEDPGYPEIDILKIFSLQLERHNASPTQNPTTTPQEFSLYVLRTEYLDLLARVEALESGGSGVERYSISSWVENNSLVSFGPWQFTVTEIGSGSSPNTIAVFAGIASFTLSGKDLQCGSVQGGGLGSPAGTITVRNGLGEFTAVDGFNYQLQLGHI